MHSVIETIEDDEPTAVAVQTLWLRNNKLHWPPGKNIDRQTPSSPQANWLQYDYKLLKTSIETFEEAIEQEKMYSKHRNSSSFREYQERKKLRRQHPVNFGDNNDLIDLNDMVSEIDNSAGEHEQNTSVGRSAPTRNFHENCMIAGTVKKPVAKVPTSSVKLQTGKKSVQSMRVVRKPLPFQNNNLKPGISKAKSRVFQNPTNHQRPRYDNFLKSGRRSDGPTKVKPKTIPSATITKQQYLKQTGEVSGTDSNDENDVPVHSNLDNASSSVEIQEEQPEIRSHKKIDVIENIQITPPTIISTQIGMSFEERILKELSEIKKNQQSFENRIESRIETFFNDQSRTHVHNRSHLQGNSESHMLGNHQSGIQFRSHQFGGIRNELQSRYRVPVSPERFVDDFEDFEEMDQHFPVAMSSHIEALEFNLRKDLEFKFRLDSRLNEISGANYKKCIRLKMKYLFTNQALEKYTWNGTEEKNAFKKLKALNNLLLQSVRQRCPKTKLDEYKDYMIQWLKHSKSRQRIVTYAYPEPEQIYEDDEDFD